MDTGCNSNKQLKLKKVINGLPVLDSHLRWQGCELFMMGAYAGLQVGPEKEI